MSNSYSCGALLKQIHDIMEKNANNVLREQDLTISQSGVLVLLDEKEGKTASFKALEKDFGVSQPTMAGILNRLEQKNLIEVPVVGTTIPHEYIGKFGSASVLLKPAAEGTGLIAGGSVRPVLELAGYRDIRTKVIGTNNPRNVVYATLEGLKSMKTAEQIAKKRGKTVAEIL